MAAFAMLLAVYAGLAACFHWLMQPTVMVNRGLAAYSPPPKTVVTYAGTPWVPPSSDPFTSYALAEPAQATGQASAAAPKAESKAHEAPARQERTVRARRTYAAPRYGSNPFGFRPWF